MESPTAKSTLSRQELYEQLWKTPATKLAKQYGISDVGLAKICQRHGIPRPPRGYWARLAHGQPIQRPPLPILDDAALDEIRVFRHSFFGKAESTRPNKSEQPKTVVPETLSNPHPLVKQTRAFLRSAKRGENGIVQPDQKTCLNIRVAPASLGRALQVFDTFLKRWEQLGGTVALGQHGDDPATLVHFGDVHAPIELFEETQREGESEQTERRWSYRNWKHRPTGKLVLQIGGATWGCQRRWADGKKLRVENRIDSFIDGLREVLESTRLHWLDEQCVARQRQRVADLRDAAKKRSAAEEKRRTELESQVRGWREAKEIREYLSALQAKLDAKLLKPINPEAFAKWLDWAMWYSDHFDPLTSAPDRPEFVQRPHNTPIDQLDLTRATMRLVEQLSAPDSDALYLVEKAAVDKLAGQWQFRSWSEICRLLEGLGYDVAGRKYHDW